MNFIRWLSNIDRRIIFVFIAAAVIIPILVPLNMPVRVTPQAEAIYNVVEGLPAGSKVLVAFDYDPAAAPECHPMAIAFLRHCFMKKHKVIIMALWPQGAQLAISAINEIRDDYNLKYGEDYVNLGYKVGGGVLIKSLGASIPAAFPADMEGRDVATLPVMKGVKNFSDIALVLDLSAGDPGIPAWVSVANAIYHVKVGGGCTAVSAPQFYPYLQTGQLVGLLGGLRGAAEYEVLIKHPAKAARRMDSQSVAHLVIILFILFANFSYFVLRRRGRPGTSGEGGPAQ
jgi:hypothetical protein